MELRLDPTNNPSNSPDPAVPPEVPSPASPDPNPSPVYQPATVAPTVPPATAVPPEAPAVPAAPLDTVPPASLPAADAAPAALYPPTAVQPDTAPAAFPAATPAAVIPIATQPPASSGPPSVMVGGNFGPDPGPAIAVNTASASGAPGTPFSGGLLSRINNKKMVFGGAAALLLIIISSSVYYFGYYMSPAVIYSQSLGHTGKGYDKLIAYIDKQTDIKAQSYTGSGSYKFKSTAFSTDGKMAFKGNDKNGEFTFDVGVAGSRVSGDIRAIKTSGSNTPDLYVKGSGLEGIGSLVGSPEVDNAISKVNNTWIFIDHSLIDTVANAAGAQTKVSGPTREDIFDEARAFGKVNQDYVFSTKKDKAVTTVLKKYGIEKVAGHKTYHYQIVLDKTNTKKYIDAQEAALKASKLGAWIKKNHYDSTAYSGFADMKKSVDRLSPADNSFDVWMDVGTRIVYKVRINDTKAKNPAQNYVDIGLDYKGGDSFPFFIAGKTNDSGFTSDFQLVSTLNAKTHVSDFTLDFKTGGSDSTTSTVKFTFQPSPTPIKIGKPAGAKPLSQILDELGAGDLLNSYTNGSVQANSKDTQRKNSIKTIQASLETYYAENVKYPNLTQINDAGWRKANLQLNSAETIFKDPDGTAATLAGKPAAHVFSYQPTTSSGAGCEVNTTTCDKYTLTATLSDGTPYSVSDFQ